MFHRHKWYPVAVESMRSFNTTGQKAGKLFTRVLYNCRDCHEVKTQDVDGHWTLEQIKGEE